MTQIATGTLLLWVSTSYEVEEYDAFLPTEVLRQIEYWNSPDADAQIREMLAEDAAAQPTGGTDAA